MVHSLISSHHHHVELSSLYQMLTADLQSFTYASQPHAAPAKATAKQPRYRDPNETPLTLMSDPRVVRGSTHSLARKITISKNELSKSHSLLMTKKGPPESDQLPRPTYSFVVKPFSNDEIDVSQYLVQQTDFRPQKKALDTQTDEFVPRPDTPEYVPAKVGFDVGTQVEDVRELFNFDEEVIPIIEVVVQKTIDQALFELSSEEELKNLESAAKEFRAEKFRSEEWMRNRENQAIGENKQRRERIEALQIARENEKRTKTIIAGVAMMRQTFDHSLQGICDGLVRRGVWKELDNAIAEKEFVPEIVERTHELVNAHAAAEEVLEAVLMETEALYQTFPTYAGPTPPRRLLVELTFRRAPVESDAPPPAEDEEGSLAAATTAKDGAPDRDTTVMTVQVGARDSIDSLNRRIRNEVYRLKQLAIKKAEAAAAALEGATAAVDEDGNPVPVPVAEEGPVVNSVLPDGAALASLRARLYEALASSLSPELLVNPTAPEPGVPARAALLRDIAYDGALWSFPFPDLVKLEILV